MIKKHIRTIIIAVLVLLTVAITVFKLDIEPAPKPAQTPPAAAATETEKPQEEPEQEAMESLPVEVKAEAEKSPAEEEKTEAAKEPFREEKKEEKQEASYEEKKQETKEMPSAEEEKVKEASSEEAAKENDTKKDGINEEENSTPTEAKAEEPTEQKHFCTIEIRCDTVTDTSVLENRAVVPYVPKDGVILKTSQLEFTPGESVFDILLRATKEKNIHMEFKDDNTYNGKYIEGINYLYEMDAGPLSGWMYKVNGRFPNYGCATFRVEDGDEIVWLYTCDLGVDVGDNSTW